MNRNPALLRRILGAAGACIALSLGCSMALAHGYKNGTIEVRHPWVRATADKSIVVSMKLRNLSDTADRLVSASSTAASTSSVGTKSVQARSDVKAVAGIDIPAKQTVVLDGASLFIRLDGLSKPLLAYDRLPLTLMFEKSGRLDIEVMIEE